ncbi:MAG TPA: hypothetical protein VLL52_03975 [Anaerolineae bacterium]|nr:hypothetical protein [Anaerolineae bacterium]
MKPNKHKQNRAQQGRARMYLKSHLNWITGYPTSLLNPQAPPAHWQPIPHHGRRHLTPLTLTRKHLHRATGNWQKIIHQFPDALPHIIPNLDHWHDALPHLLDLLKPAVHDGHPLPPHLLNHYPQTLARDARHHLKQNPTLKPLIHALSWQLYLYPQEFAQALTWLNTYAPHCVRYLAHLPDKQTSLNHLLILWDLSRRDNQRRHQRTHSLIIHLTNPLAYTLPTYQIPEYLQQWDQKLLDAQKQTLNDNQPPPKPKPTLGPNLQQILLWLWPQSRGPRRHALNLLNTFFPDDLLTNWQTWWQTITPYLQHGRRLLAISPTSAVTTPAKALRQTLNATPPPPRPQAPHLLDLLKSYSQYIPAKSHHTITGILNQLPLIHHQTFTRPAFMHTLYRHTSEHKQQLPLFLHHFHQYLRTNLPTDQLLLPWDSNLGNWDRRTPEHYWHLIEDILDETPTPAQYETIFATIHHHLHQDLPDQWGSPCWARTVEFALALPQLPLDQRYHYIGQLIDHKAHDRYCRTSFIQLAHQLTLPHPDTFGQIFTRLRDSNYNQDDYQFTLDHIIPLLTSANWPALFHYLITSPQHKQLWPFIDQLNLLHRHHLLLPPPPYPAPHQLQFPDWVLNYPPHFHDNLTLLNAITPSAATIADRILGTNFPLPQNLQRQIDALQAKLDTHPHLQKQIDKLQQRLTTPTSISPTRVHNLQHKLHQTIHLLIFDQWQKQITPQLHQLIYQQLNLDPATHPTLPPWLFAPRQLTIFAKLPDLSPQFQQLAHRLFHTRLGPPPWDLRHDPANAHFLDQLRHKRVNVDAWLNPPPPQTVVGANGRSLTLAISQDPLDIFHMGTPFDTCLSPGNANFFSVFANAADINKQVLFLRDQQGQIVGRCLLALNDDGHLLTFNPYCHDSEFKFDQTVGQFARDLVLQLGTAAIPDGHISPLIAPDWYDDGSVDLAQQFTFLNEDAPFRHSLKDIPLDQFVPTLIHNFHPLPLNEFSLPLIIAIDELDERPQLIAPLLPYLRQTKNMPHQTWVKTIDLAHQIDATPFVHWALRHHIIPFLLDNRISWPDETIMDLITDMNPSLALRILRHGRPYGVHNDEDEHDNYRRQLLAQTHRQLNRHHLANRLIN